MRVDQCVSALRVALVPVLFCLHSSCVPVADGGGTVKFVNLALKVVVQSDKDFVDVILLYPQSLFC